MNSAEKIKTLENRIAELEKENRLLLESIHHLTRKLYGRKSEKTSVLNLGQLSFLALCQMLGLSPKTESK